MSKGLTIVIVALILYTAASFTFYGHSISYPTSNSDNASSDILFPLPKKLDLDMNASPFTISPC